MSPCFVTLRSRAGRPALRLLCTTGLVAFGAPLATGGARAQSFINVCTGLGVTLPALQQVPNNTSGLLTGVLSPVTTALNGTIADVNTSLTNVLSGATIGVGVLQNGSVVAVPSGQCNTASNTLQIGANSGISLGGGQVNGLGGTGNPTSSAGALTAIAIGNNAVTGTGLANAIALGTNATSNYANSIALGANSVTGRGAVSGYTAFGLSATQTSAGEVSVGSPGAERQITNVAAGSADTDAVNVGQLRGAIEPFQAESVLAVKYTPDGNGNPTAVVNLASNTSLPAGTTQVTLTGLAPGALAAGSKDAVNGAQLYGTGTSLATILGGGATFDPTTGQVTAPSYVIGGVNYTTVGSALSALDTEANQSAGALKYFSVNSTLATAAATGTNATAVGPNAQAQGTGALAIGTNSLAVTQSATAIGTGATAQGGQAVAVGAGTTATGTGATAIGSTSTATGTGAVAVGAATAASGQGAVALGNASIANGQGAVAIGNASTAGAAGAIALGDGATANVAGGVALGSGAVAAANNNTTGTVALATPGAVTLGYSNAGNTATGAVSVGTTGAYRQIQNVADGSAAHDAVNVEQLASVVSQTNAALAPVQSAAKLSVQYTADANGNPTNAIDLTKGGTLQPVSLTGLAPATTASGAVALSQLPMQYSTAAAPTTPNPAVPSNDVTLVGAMAGAVALHNVASGALTAGSTDAVNGGQLYTTNTKLAALGHSSVQYATDATGNTLSSITLASDQGGPVIIHNLAPGVAATDAATVGQVQAASANSVQYNVVNGVKSNTITLAGGSAGAVTVSNVAPGVLGTDAVNVNQLQASAAGTLTQANAYTAQQINNLTAYTNQQIAQARSDAAGGTALALAASGLRYDDRPGKFSMTGATSYYHDQMGVAFGLGHTSEDGRLRLNAAVTASPTMTHPDVGAVVGASYSLD